MISDGQYAQILEEKTDHFTCASSLPSFCCKVVATSGRFLEMQVPSVIIPLNSIVYHQPSSYGISPWKPPLFRLLGFQKSRTCHFQSLQVEYSMSIPTGRHVNYACFLFFPIGSSIFIPTSSTFSAAEFDTRPRSRIGNSMKM